MKNINKLIKYCLYNTVIYNLQERSLSRHHSQYWEKGAKSGNLKKQQFLVLDRKIGVLQIWNSQNWREHCTSSDAKSIKVISVKLEWLSLFTQQKWHDWWKPP